MPSPNEANRDFDVVVFGATGFVGRLTADYLARQAPADLRIALAGRSPDRLERARAELGEKASEWPLIVAESCDEQAMTRLAGATRVVATTVGPYMRYGMPLVAACAAAGTHYADLTGEVLFMRRSIDEHDADARASGARIVHTCGFDSIPSDLGALALHAHATGHDLGGLRDTTYVMVSMRGGMSGGTVDSLRGQLDAARRDPAARKLMGDPYSLSPDRALDPDPGPERDPVSVVHDEALGGFLAPFLMGGVNTRVVRRSNALLEYAYGRDLRYRELMLAGGLPLGPMKAAGIAGGMAALVGGLSFAPTRALLDRILPDPGEGPDEKARESGFFHVDIHAETESGERIVSEIRASGDPGYKATAVMLGESALALALDEERLPDAAGVLTPATAMGEVLTERLRRAGHTYRVRAAGAD
ncbi:MAG: saccharopine dehydrogenase NADP-binding domain-containing protein [Thermoleophilia bacterium]|nr:saccharopine dehydrogenase NADP-binding domain-containing protein [Thermoleophilia bacterium]